MKPLISSFLLCFGCRKFLLDASLLACELAQVVELGATHLAMLVDLDAVDVGRLDGEDTLHTNSARHLANGETLLLAMTGDADDNTAIELDALLGAFNDLVSYGDGVARVELFEFLAGGFGVFCHVGGKCLLGNFD